MQMSFSKRDLTLRAVFGTKNTVESPSGSEGVSTTTTRRATCKERCLDERYPLHSVSSGEESRVDENEEGEEEKDLEESAEMAEEVERFQRNMNATRGELRKAAGAGQLDLDMGPK